MRPGEPRAKEPVEGLAATVFAQGLGFPEGPVLRPGGGLLVCELAAGRVTLLREDGSVEARHAVGAGPNGAAFGPDGQVFVCDSGGFGWVEKDGRLMPGPQTEGETGQAAIRVLDPASGAVRPLYTAGPDGALAGPNDIVFDGHGGFWFSDYGKFGPRQRDRGSLYYARADGHQIIEVVNGLEGPNGVGLSPDGARLYLAETWTARLWCFELDAPGRLSRQPRAFDGRRGQLLYATPEYRLFDSLALDAEGNICVAALPGEIRVISPRGKLLEIVQVPDPFVTNLCLAPAPQATAYATLSSTGQVLRLEGFRPGLPLAHHRPHA